MVKFMIALDIEADRRHVYSLYNMKAFVFTFL